MAVEGTVPALLNPFPLWIRDLTPWAVFRGYLLVGVELMMFSQETPAQAKLL